MIHMDRRLWLMFSMCTFAVARRDCDCKTDLMSECQAIVQDVTDCEDTFWSFGACGGKPSTGSGQLGEKMATEQCCPRKCCELGGTEECQKSNEHPDQSGTSGTVATTPGNVDVVAVATTPGNVDVVAVATTPGNVDVVAVATTQANVDTRATTQAPASVDNVAVATTQANVDTHATTQAPADVDNVAVATTQPNVDTHEKTQTPGNVDDAAAAREALSKSWANSEQFTCGVLEHKLKQLLIFDQEADDTSTLDEWIEFKERETSKNRFLDETQTEIEKLKLEKDTEKPKADFYATQNEPPAEELAQLFLFEPLKEAEKACLKPLKEPDNDEWLKYESQFTANANKSFKEHNSKSPTIPLKTTKFTVAKACENTLITKKLPQGRYCQKRCSKLALIAEKLSKDTFNQYPEVFEWDGTENLRTELRLNQIHDEINRLTGEWDKCTKAWKVILAFRTQLEALRDAYDKALDFYAEVAETTEETLAILNASQENETIAGNLQKAAIAALKAAKANTSAAEEAADAANAALAEVSGEADEALLQLQRARNDFQATNEAFKRVLEVKSLVTRILSAMREHYEKMVVFPMQMMGFTDENNVDNRDIRAQQHASAEAIKGFFEAMDDTCKGAEQSMGFSEKNLSILCNFQSLEDATAEIVAAVDVKRNSVNKTVAKLLDWQSPYWNHYEWVPGDSANCAGLMSDGCEKWLETEKAEPAGLRKVVGIFQDTPFYTEYLQRWRSDDAHSFLTLSRDFQASLARANQSAEEFQESFAKFNQALKAAEAVAKDAEEKLQHVLKTQITNNATLVAVTKALNDAQQVRARHMEHFKLVQKQFAAGSKQFEDAHLLYLTTAQQGFKEKVPQSLVEMVSRRAKVSRGSTRLVSPSVAIRPHGLVQSFSLPRK